jgi:hypothetical protein
MINLTVDKPEKVMGFCVPMQINREIGKSSQLEAVEFMNDLKERKDVMDKRFTDYEHEEDGSNRLQENTLSFYLAMANSKSSNNQDCMDSDRFDLDLKIQDMNGWI